MKGQAIASLSTGGELQLGLRQDEGNGVFKSGPHCAELTTSDRHGTGTCLRAYRRGPQLPDLLFLVKCTLAAAAEGAPGLAVTWPPANVLNLSEVR